MSLLPFLANLIFFSFVIFIEQIDRISLCELENILEEKEDLIVHQSHPAYKKVVEAANKILEANKDIPEIFEKTWTVFLGNHSEEFKGII